MDVLLVSHGIPNVPSIGYDVIESAIQVTTFIDPIGAFLEFKPFYYGLLLVDIHMPSVSGYELIEKK